MKRTYYVEMLSWTVGGDVIYPVLSRNEATEELGFKQGFERAWSAVEFETPKDALALVRIMLGPDRTVYLDEDQSRILIVDGDEVCLLYKVMIGGAE